MTSFLIIPTYLQVTLDFIRLHGSSNESVVVLDLESPTMSIQRVKSLNPISRPNP